MLRFLQTIYPSLILHIWQINQWENYFPFKDSSYFPQSSEIKPNILNIGDPAALRHAPCGLVCARPTSNQFSRCFQFSILLCLWPGGGCPEQEVRVVVAQGRRGQVWVRIWWLYCSHCHHHVITATGRSKLPPPALKIKLSVILCFWFLVATDGWRLYSYLILMLHLARDGRWATR